MNERYNKIISMNIIIKIIFYVCMYLIILKYERLRTMVCNQIYTFKPLIYERYNKIIFMKIIIK